MGFDRDIDHSIFLQSVPIGSNVIRVASINGNDTTGVKGDGGKPFATYAAANAIAVVGDRVLGSGDVDEKDLFKDGVDYDIFGNINYTGASLGGIADDTATGQNGKIVSNITVFGTVTWNGPAGATTTSAVYFLKNAASDIKINCTNSLHNSFGSARTILLENGAKLNYIGDIFKNFFVRSSSELTVNGDTVNDLDDIWSSVQDADSKLFYYGNISDSVSIQTIEIENSGFGYIRGDMVNTRVDSNSCTRVDDGTLDMIGNSTCAGGAGLFIDGITATDFVDYIGDATGGVKANFGSGILFGNAGSINVRIRNSVITGIWDHADGGAITTADTGQNTVILQNVVLISPALAVSGIFIDSSLVPIITKNYSVNSNLAIAAAVIQQVSNILVNSDVE